MGISQFDISLIFENKVLLFQKQTGKEPETLIREMFKSQLYADLMAGVEVECEFDLLEHSDDILYFQISTVQKLPDVMGISQAEFWDLEEKYNFLKLLRVSYGWFHLTGIKGIAEAFQRLMRGEGMF